MTKNQLQEAMVKYGQSLDDITSIYSIEKGIIDIKEDLIPTDSCIFTKDFTYFTCWYDGQEWFDAVPTSHTVAVKMEEYGEYGG